MENRIVSAGRRFFGRIWNVLIYGLATLCLVSFVVKLVSGISVSISLYAGIPASQGSWGALVGLLWQVVLDAVQPLYIVVALLLADRLGKYLARTSLTGRQRPGL